MSKLSYAPESSLNGTELSDSDNSRDVNLNSKKFADCNLISNELENNQNAEGKNNSKPVSDLQQTENREAFDQNVPSDMNPDNNDEPESSNNLQETGKPSTENNLTSQPGDSQQLDNLFSVSSNASFIEPEDDSEKCLVPKTILNQKIPLTSEEIDKKFQDLSFAFKTDSLTIPTRLHLMKRRRDQAESNIEHELRIIKAKLRALQFLGLNSEFLHLMTELKNQLDFVLNAAMQLSSSAESYGYAQHEEKLLEFVTVMLQHVENIENSKSEISKNSEKVKAEAKKSPNGSENGLVRRKSVTSPVSESSCRRRASIAALPRMGYSTSMFENASNGKKSPWTPGNSKRYSVSQSTPRTHSTSLPGIEDVGRDFSDGLHRSDSKNKETSMNNIEEFPEQRSSTVDSELLEKSSLSDGDLEAINSSLHLKQLIESIEVNRRKSSAQEQFSAINCLRRILEWNKILLNSTRFRWPENILHHVPFCITWYVVFVLAMVFIGGFFTGISGCYTYSCLKYSALWFIVPALINFVRRFYRFLLPLFFTILLALALVFFWLTNHLLPQLKNEEVDVLFKTLGLEIRYLYGAPPV